MDSGGWSRIEDLFHQAADLAPAGRPAFLDRFCGGDEELRREVESLLAADAPEGGLIQAAVGEAIEQLPGNPDEGSELIGTRVGRYSITGLIGKGGMGIVYRAAREDDFRMQVAIKLLKRGTDTEAALKRFRVERQVLAGLQHPNIARLLDGGATEAGLPYFVMEFVDGTPLLEYAAPLPVRQRLELFRSVCSAVQYAHQNRIVHRDIKSANILVTPEGTPKLLDFGIAKLLDPAAEGALTATGARLMTPDYASPEQVRGEPLTTATDVYSLGMVLYELLTGRLAHHVETGSEPPKPSVIAKDLDPDLDNIVLMALRKEPERRYASVERFSEDLDRFLHNLPVHARQESLPYRGRKFLKRNRVPTAAAAVSAVMVLALVAGVGRFTGGGAEAGVRSIAVLPLENLSGDPEQEYFAEGMTDALIGDLARIRSLRVISRGSVMRYKGNRKPASQTARELNADALVEGSVLRSGNRVRITVRLTAGAMDRILWSQIYDRELRDVSALQSEAAKAIAREIQIEISQQENARLSRARPLNVQAYEAYLKGRYHWYKVTQDGFDKSMRYFKEAIEIDPTYSLAWAGLADTYYQISNKSLPPGEAMPKARAAAQRALSIDRTLAEAHVTLAQIQAQFDWDWAAAETSYKRAIEFNPSYAHAHVYYSYYLAEQGRLEEAIGEAAKAYDLDPLPPLMSGNLAWMYYLARRTDQAIAQCRKSLELDPESSANFSLALAYEQKGMFEEAIAEFSKAQRGAFPQEILSFLGHVYAVSGKTEQANRMLTELRELSRHRHVDPFFIGIVYAGLRDADKAFEYFEKAYQERSEELLMLKVDPRFDSVRADPRFNSLVRRIGLPL